MTTPRPRTRVLFARASCAALLSSTLCALGACSSIKPPAVTDATAAVTSATDDGTALDVLVNVTNDNDEGLPLRDVTYTVEVGGVRVFSGTRSAEASVPAHGSQLVRLPASVPTQVWTSAAAGGSSFRVAGSMTYVTPGAFAEALFDAGVRVPSMGFSASGELGR